VREADNLIAIFEPIALNISQPYRPPRPFTAIALLYFTLLSNGKIVLNDKLKHV
jgi:hypothetical protein